MGSDHFYAPIQKVCMPLAIRPYQEKFFSAPQLFVDEQNDPIFDHAEFWREITRSSKETSCSAPVAKETIVVPIVSQPQPEISPMPEMKAEPVAMQYELPHLDMFIGVDEEQMIMHLCKN